MWGQAIVVKPTLMFPANVQFRDFSSSFIGQEHFPNCIVEYLPNSEQMLRENFPIQGRQYSIAQMDVLVLYALAPGKIVIDSVPFEFSVRRGIFSQEMRRANSAPIVLDIIDLPSEGKPQDFKGAVGSLQIETARRPARSGSGERR